MIEEYRPAQWNREVPEVSGRSFGSARGVLAIGVVPAVIEMMIIEVMRVIREFRIVVIGARVRRQQRGDLGGDGGRFKAGAFGVEEALRVAAGGMDELDHRLLTYANLALDEDSGRTMGERYRSANYVEQTWVGGEDRGRQAQRSRENEAGSGDGAIADEIGRVDRFRDRFKRGTGLEERDGDDGLRVVTMVMAQAEFDA